MIGISGDFLGSERGILKHEGTKGKKLSADFAEGADGASRSRVATPWGSRQAVPFRSELLRARTVLIRRLCRLAKLLFSR